MTANTYPDWIDQVQQFHSGDPALVATQGEERTRDPQAVAAALAAIAGRQGAITPADPQKAGHSKIIKWLFRAIRESDGATAAEAAAALSYFLNNIPGEAAPSFKGPAQFTQEEIAEGNRGIRWVTAEGVFGRPSDHDVREYLERTPLLRGCTCDGCRGFYVTAGDAAGALYEADDSSAQAGTTSYVVMRGVEHSSQKQTPLPDEAVGRKIHRVWRMLHEASFVRMGKPSHGVNAFLDNEGRDWSAARDGKSLRYFARSSEEGDPVDIILELKD